MVERKYILQGQDFICAFITMLNYLIHVDGKSPLKYNSKKFWKFLDGHDGMNGGIISAKGLLKKLNLKHIDCPKYKSMRMFKLWMIRNLKKGECIDFCIHKFNGGLHSVLIVGYSKVFDSFKCINTQLLTSESVIEYLTFEQLTECCYFDINHRKSKFAPYYNKKERTSLIARTCINETKIIKKK